MAKMDPENPHLTTTVHPDGSMTIEADPEGARALNEQMTLGKEHQPEGVYFIYGAISGVLTCSVLMAWLFAFRAQKRIESAL